tara:strand:+ start:140 stop:685 length:546 start_codon:yes stop_codon:yes gene_type:complete
MIVFCQFSCSSHIESAEAKKSQVKEKFSYSLPQNWGLGYKVRQKNMLMKEFIPKGQDVKNWSEMLTIQIFHGGINRTALDFSNGVKHLWAQACPGANFSKNFTRIENGYQAIYWKQICPKNPQTGKPETLSLKIISGNDSFYVAQKAWKSLPLKKDNDLWLGLFFDIAVCDTTIEKHSCSM